MLYSISPKSESRELRVLEMGRYACEDTVKPPAIIFNQLTHTPYEMRSVGSCYLGDVKITFIFFTQRRLRAWVYLANSDVQGLEPDVFVSDAQSTLGKFLVTWN